MAIEEYRTIGIRFAIGVGSNPGKVYTYKVRAGAEILLGDELVLDTPYGPSVGFVVRKDKTNQDTDPGIQYKYATRKTIEL